MSTQTDDKPPFRRLCRLRQTSCLGSKARKSVTLRRSKAPPVPDLSGRADFVSTLSAIKLHLCLRSDCLLSQPMVVISSEITITSVSLTMEYGFCFFHIFTNLNTKWTIWFALATHKAILCITVK